MIPVHLFAVKTDSQWLTFVTLLMFLALVPIAAGLSVLRYRLYDVDRIVAATTTYALLTFGLTTIYAGVVWVGSQVSTVSSPSPAATATVGAVAAATLAAPMRAAIQRRVDRRFNRRAFEAVRTVREAITVDRAGLDPESLLRTALADESVNVAYPASDGWVDRTGAPARAPADHVVVSRAGRTVARIGYDPAKSDESTVARVGDVAAAELDNTRLRAELQARLAELAESRARIAGAQRDERRRIERDLHDGAQQSLLALAFELQSAHLNGEPERMQAALANGVTSAPVSVTCLADRFLPAVEFTCWLVIAEAVVNAQKHSNARQIDINVKRVDDAVGIRVQDNGCGGADSERRGLRGLRDRVEAAGGHATISSNAKGTTIRATVPCGS